MFEAYETRQVSKHRWIGPVIVALVVLALVVALVVYRRHAEVVRAQGDLDKVWKSIEAPADSFVRVELPGMSLEAPSAAKPTGDYTTGSVSQLFPEWMVTWQSGKLPPAEALQSIVGAMMRAVEQQRHTPVQLASAADVTLDGGRARQFELRADGALVYSAWVTFGECDGRVLQVLNGGVSGVKDTHDRMVRSFRCHPDPSRSSEELTVAVDVRPGWHLAMPGGKAMLANARDVVVQMRTLPAVPGAPQPEQYIAAAAGGAGLELEGKPVSRKGRIVGIGRIQRDGSSSPMAMVMWTCADRRLAVVYVNASKRADLEQGIDLALTGRCLAPGEPAPDYPPPRLGHR